MKVKNNAPRVIGFGGINTVPNGTVYDIPDHWQKSERFKEMVAAGDIVVVEGPKPEPQPKPEPAKEETPKKGK